MWNHYFSPESLNDALCLINKDPDQTRLIAGGTDLVLDFSNGRLPAVDAVVDISNVPELKQISKDSECITIGSSVTLTEIIRSDIIKKHARILREAARQIAGLQIRNIATLGGNVVNASPAADMVPPLLVLECTVEIINSNQVIRETPLRWFLQGNRQVDLSNGEIVTGFKFKVPQAETNQYFRKVQNRRSMAIAVLNLAILMNARNKRITRVRIAMGAVAPTAVRIKSIEERLTGLPIHEADNPQIYKEIYMDISPISDFRATRNYRLSVAQSLTHQAVVQMLSLPGSIQE
jgi:carbon-monoxide dehydrogenase medium subunit